MVEQHKTTLFYDQSHIGISPKLDNLKFFVWSCLPILKYHVNKCISRLHLNNRCIHCCTYVSFDLGSFHSNCYFDSAIQQVPFRDHPLVHLVFLNTI